MTSSARDSSVALNATVSVWDAETANANAAAGTVICGESASSWIAGRTVLGLAPVTSIVRSRVQVAQVEAPVAQVVLQLEPQEVAL